MVQQYYVDTVTEISENRLQTVFQNVEPPVCLLGGWAVHLHVNNGYQQEHQRRYIGARDIDLGVHVNGDWIESTLQEQPVNRTLEQIESELNFERSRFGFVQTVVRDTGEVISEEEARNYSLHEIFQLYIDIIPDTESLDTFEQVFGFRPPAETLLSPVFQNGKGEPLRNHMDWSVPDPIKIADPELLAAMKIRSIPHRDKDHKRVKDIADLHSLLWYVKDYNQISRQALEYVTNEDVTELESHVNRTVLQNAANLLQIQPRIIEDSIQQLIVQNR